MFLPARNRVTQRSPGNLDGQEGGLGALSQAALCDDVVGWNSQSRKIVLFVTDAVPNLSASGHIAEKCKMNRKSGTITSSRPDYANVGQISRILKKKDIAVIFLVPKKLQLQYEDLAKKLPAASVGILEDNISELIQNKVSMLIDSSIGLTSHSSDSAVQVKMTAVCPSKTVTSDPTSTVRACQDGLPLNSKRLFNVTVTSSICLADFVTVTLSPISSAEEKVILRTDTTCKTETGCGPPHRICSGRGRCECGMCRCSSPRYSGPHCECDRMGCARASDDNSVCGGPMRGICNCNFSCSCRQGFSGQACDCMEDKSSCFGVAPGTPVTELKACSGHGECECGLCICQMGYRGLTCSEKVSSGTSHCTWLALQQCVKCLLAKHLDDSNIADTDCSCPSEVAPTSVSFVKKLNTGDGSTRCVVFDASDCRVTFEYRSTKWSSRLALSIATETECPFASNLTAERHQVMLRILRVMLIAVGVVVLVKLLFVLVWKICVTVRDRRAAAAAAAAATEK